MDSTSYEHGRSGIAPGPNTDMDSYMEGKRAAEERNRVPIDGAAFTLLLTSPLLFTVFPVWGLSLYVAGGGVW